eukprot:5867141-Alexandrium_andersonii.AAC.1
MQCTRARRRTTWSPSSSAATSTSPPSPANLQLALQDAASKLSDTQHAAMWARMLRTVQKPSCPPLLREKWEAAGKDRSKKNQVFEVLRVGTCGRLNTGIPELPTCIRCVCHACGSESAK